MVIYIFRQLKIENYHKIFKEYTNKYKFNISYTYFYNYLEGVL